MHDREAATRRTSVGRRRANARAPSYGRLSTTGTTEPESTRSPRKVGRVEG